MKLIKMFRLINYLIILFLFSCKNETPMEGFEPPKIVQLDKHDIVKYINLKAINPVYPKFVGKFKFSKELSINFDSLLTIQQDTSDFSYDTWLWEESDSLNNDGFQIISDYNTDIAIKSYTESYYHTFPVYIVNETKKTKLLLAKDSWVFATQEAKHNHLWRAIERDGYDFCGNGGWGLKIHPNEFAMFLMQKYTGDFKTQIRTKLRIGETWYVSKPYDGNIDTMQFYPIINPFIYPYQN